MLKKVDDLFNSQRHKEKKIQELLIHDLKLYLDLQIEEVIIRELSRNYPGHSILSEEKGITLGQEEYTWVIDPLDGTVNYYHDIPYYGISVACFHKKLEILDSGYNYSQLLGKPLLGVVYLPQFQTLYYAVGNKGAYVNGIPLACPRGKGLDETIIALNFSARGSNMGGMAHLLERLVKKARKVRSFGATAVDLAYVAQGKTGGLIQRGTHLWDFAAGYILVREAGGVVSLQEREGGQWDIIASFSKIHAQLKGLAGFV